MADLFGNDEALKPDHRPADRLFLAAFPDPDTATRLQALANELRARHGLQGRPLLPGRFHVTLHHLGDFHGIRQDIVEAASRAVATLVATPSFEVRFDRAVSFRARDSKPLVLLGDTEGVAPLLAFHDRLELALARSGIKPEQRFTPHLTLLYDRQGIPETPVEPVAWRVQEVVLVHSLLGKTQHIPLARWSLGLDTVSPPPPAHDFSDADQVWMRRALALAEQAAAENDEVPVGAVLVGPDGEFLAEASNLNAGTHDASAHAEILALRAAGERLQNKRLSGCTLYVTLEPCAMCAMAMVHARIGRLVYAARAPKTGAAGSAFDLLADPGHNHAVRVEGGLMAEEAGAMLGDYFRRKRGRGE